MNKIESAQLLTIASGFDRYIAVGEVNATAWHAILTDVDYDLAVQALIAWYEIWDGRTQLHPSVILEPVRSAIARDVRAAKAFGILPKHHPRDKALPPDVTTQLAALRERRYQINPPDDEPLEPVA